ncbi:CoA transferase, partial [Streptomyces achromogenes]|uniref:CoA transferase n=1 Tax=Streptomyces achromogenes TaxID=67255 RepID=UPI003F4D2E13
MDPPGPAGGLVAEHLRLLGAQDAGRSEHHVGLGGAGFAGMTAHLTWGDRVVDETTVQAATGIMAVHGRRDGSPRGLAADYASTAAGVLAVQGLLAGLLAQARGGRVRHTEVTRWAAGPPRRRARARGRTVRVRPSPWPVWS